MNQKLENKVFCSDANKFLNKIPDNFVTLVYLDPPFFSNRVYEIVTENGISNSFNDKWIGGLEEYLKFMQPILQECKRILNKKGSLYLHCDWHVSHYLKIELDKIFGYNNFQNEIIWRRHNAHNDTKQGSKMFGRVHDAILFYSKTRQHTWNPIYEPYPEEYIKKYYRHTEPKTGRKYAHGDLSGPCGRSKRNPQYEFLGITRYWRFSKENMLRMYNEGRIIQTKKGNVPVLKRYLDEVKGIMLQDVWQDIKSVQVLKKESVGYPTQKPIQLLQRIIKVSSNEGDVVLDGFCGSGTTLLAAKKMNRRFIGIDENKEACKLAKHRLKDKKSDSTTKTKLILANHPTN